MCGIIGISAKRSVLDEIVQSLARLEPRGYDSVGLCARTGTDLIPVKVVGDVARLRLRLNGLPSASTASSAIGHTRWATHGAVSEANAHPFLGCTGHFAVAMNGVIDDADRVRTALVARGHRFSSQTDSEVFVHLLEDAHGSLAARVAAVAAALRGSFSVIALESRGGDKVVGLRRGAPLVVAAGADRYALCSATDAVPWADSFQFLEDGDVAEIHPHTVRIHAADGSRVHRASVSATAAPDVVADAFDTAFESEIRSQPVALENTIRALLRGGDITLGDEVEAVIDVLPRRIVLVGCGSAAHAAAVAAVTMEAAAGVPCAVRIASEWNAGRERVDARTLVVGVSQSGETADTLDALRSARAAGARTLAVTNSPSSQIVRETEGAIITHAGVERSVASSKTFSTQVVALAMLGLRLRARGSAPAHDIDIAALELAVLPELVDEFLAGADAGIDTVAALLAAAPYLVYLGSGAGLPIAAEGALKIREVAAIPVEVHPLGELKHGPFALLGPGVPVVCVVPGVADARTLASFAEIRARGAVVIAVASGLDHRLAESADVVLSVPLGHGVAASVLSVLPLQLLALRTAELRGMSIDRPRNLAKTVTVR